MLPHRATRGFTLIETVGASITANPLSAIRSGYVASMSVHVDSLNLSQALIVNGILDGPSEVSPSLEGRFRFPTPASPATLATPAFFLAPRCRSCEALDQKRAASTNRRLEKRRCSFLPRPASVELKSSCHGVIVEADSP